MEITPTSPKAVLDAHLRALRHRERITKESLAQVDEDRRRLENVLGVVEDIRKGLEIAIDRLEVPQPAEAHVFHDVDLSPQFANGDAGPRSPDVSLVSKYGAPAYDPTPRETPSPDDKPTIPVAVEDLFLKAKPGATLSLLGISRILNDRYGFKKGSVNAALSNLVKSGSIVRVDAGIYRRTTPDDRAE